MSFLFDDRRQLFSRQWVVPTGITRTIEGTLREIEPLKSLCALV